MADSKQNSECTSFSALPSELLLHLLSYLDTPAPSDSRLHGLKNPYATTAEPGEQPSLKACSLVNWRWRTAALPLLFRHVLWSVDHDALLGLDHSGHDDDNSDPVAKIPILDFLRARNLGPYVQTFALLVDDKSSPLSARDKTDDGSIAAWTMYNVDNNWLWEVLFGLIDPLRFTVAASPRVLASLFARTITHVDARSFGEQLHLVSLSRGKCHQRRQPSESSGSTSPPAEELSSSAGPYPSVKPKTNFYDNDNGPAIHIPCKLFTIRPWTKLLFNEGDWRSIYASDTFFLKIPPSILGAILGCIGHCKDEALIPKTVTDLSYVAGFPLSSHISTLVRNFPVIERFFVQLVPREPGLSSQYALLNNTEEADLWTERNSAYQIIMSAILGGEHSDNWDTLREFESGDTADREAWDLTVQYTRLAETDWVVAGDGLFVRQRARPR